MKRLQLVLWWFLLAACVSTSSEAQTVYITKTGKKYHASSCRYLHSSKIAIKLDDAKEQGYTPCSVCHPDANTDSSSHPGSGEVPSEKKKPVETHAPARQSTTTSSQCTAKTKSGLRCKRTTTAANGRCWQHQ